MIKYSAITISITVIFTMGNIRKDLIKVVNNLTSSNQTYYNHIMDKVILQQNSVFLSLFDLSHVHVLYIQ